MQTLDQSLANLYKTGLVTYREVLERAGNPTEFKALAGPDPDEGAPPAAEKG